MVLGIPCLSAGVVFQGPEDRCLGRPPGFSMKLAMRQIGSLVKLGKGLGSSRDGLRDCKSACVFLTAWFCCIEVHHEGLKPSVGFEF